MYDWRGKAGMILCACAGRFEFAHFAHVPRHVFARRGPFHQTFIWYLGKTEAFSGNHRIYFVTKSENGYNVGQFKQKRCHQIVKTQISKCIRDPLQNVV